MNQMDTIKADKAKLVASPDPVEVKTDPIDALQANTQD